MLLSPAYLTYLVSADWGRFRAPFAKDPGRWSREPLTGRGSGGRRSGELSALQGPVPIGHYATHATRDAEARITAGWASHSRRVDHGRSNRRTCIKAILESAGIATAASIETDLQ